MTLSLEAKMILDALEHLKSTPSGYLAGLANDHFKLTAVLFQDALLELIFSGEVTDSGDLRRLIFAGSHGGSSAKEANEGWIPFFARVWERHNELPYEVSGGIEWNAAQWGLIP